MNHPEKGKSGLPPKAADLLLELFYEDDPLEEVQGDLHEQFYERVDLYGCKTARKMYWFDVFRFLSPFQKKRKENLPGSFASIDIISAYAKEAYSDFKKNKLFAFINLLGLSIGFSAFLAITQYVIVEKSFDRFHEKISNIYRIPFSWEPLENGNALELYASNVPAFGPAAMKDLPEVQAFTRLFDVRAKSPVSVITHFDSGGKRHSFNEDRGFYADPGLLSIFNFPLSSGSREYALNEPLSILLSESLSQKIFKNTDPIGATLQVNIDGTEEYKVTGIFKDVPKNSHLKFDYLLSYSSLGNGSAEKSWGWSQFYTYVEVEEGSNIAALNKKLNALIKQYKGENSKNEVFLQAVEDIHLKSNLRYEASEGGSEEMVNFMLIISFVILLIAFINYINLSSAKALERAKVVGIKKVIGATEMQIFFQYLLQTLIYTCLALIGAIVILAVTIPKFLSPLTNNMIDLSMFKNLSFWLSAFTLISAGTLLAGIYPAVIISSYKSVEVLKGQLKTSSRGLSLRKGLVLWQFVASISLAICTLVIINQFDFMINKDLGIDMEQTVIMKTPAADASHSVTKLAAFKNELKKSLAVEEVAFSTSIPGKEITTTRGMVKINGEPRGNTNFFYVGIDTELLELYDMNLLAGRFFDANSSESRSIIINESAVKQLQIEDPQSAINEKVLISGKEPQLNIIGVISDYHNKSLDKPIEPIVFYYDSLYQGFLSVKLNKTENVSAAISTLEKSYSGTFKDEPFEYFFLDEFFNRQYQQEQINIKIFGFFSSFSILIACLGLIGLTLYATFQRAKEIIVRKILGATTLNILYLLLKEMIKTIGMATVIAWPIAFFLSNRWLENYAFRVELNFLYFLLPGVLVAFIAISIVMFQIIKAARILPVKYLKEG